MSRIDHATEALAVLKASARFATTEELAGITSAQEAQVHATLSLVETQRIALLMVMYGFAPEGSRARDRVVNRLMIDTGCDVDIHPDIAAALGIGGESDG